MTNVSVYDTTAALLEDIADRHDVTVAEVIDAMIDCFADNSGEEGYL